MSYEPNGLALLTRGIATQDLEEYPSDIWLDTDAAINIDPIALTTYGLLSNVETLDRHLDTIWTDVDDY